VIAYGSVTEYFSVSNVFMELCYAVFFIEYVGGYDSNRVIFSKFFGKFTDDSRRTAVAPGRFKIGNADENLHRFMIE
jgi:hypothetical protein